MTLGMEVGLGPGHTVLNRNPAPLPEKGAEPPISTHVYCRQTEVSLTPGDFVLAWDPAPLPKYGRRPQIFSPRLLWPNGCIDQDATWYGGRPRPTRHCVRRGPSSPPL